MKDMMHQDSLGAVDKELLGSAAETLIEASLAAQTRLVASDESRVIPATAESPIPVLAARNRTPDPRTDTNEAETALS